jgi:hypothetical protein
MRRLSRKTLRKWPTWAPLACGLAGIVGLLLPMNSEALPLFARQTGHNCIACHAGGQFPELTPYGRKFKLTGYTLGERVKVPLAVMGVASVTKVRNTNGSSDIPGDFPKDGVFNPTTVSVLCCGKLTDNLGLFAQWTHDAYDHQNDRSHWIGLSHIDQFDLRLADRFIDPGQDLIVGASLNNNPGVSDVWNTHNSAFTPVPTYVPESNATTRDGKVASADLKTMPILQQLGQASAGLSTYAFWNNMLYAEVGAYQKANRAFSFMTDKQQSDPAMVKLKGFNPYWRLALNHDWGPHSAMVGMHGMNAETYADPTINGGPTTKFRDVGVDGQYQYILDPYSVTAMFSYTHEKQRYADELWNPTNPGYNVTSTPLAANASNDLDYLRLKLTYVYQAKYGASLAYSSVKGSADSTVYANNTSNTPDSRLWTPEIFWMPIQYVRVGLQYYKWDLFNGSKSAYDASGQVPGRNASDNNMFFLYVWAAY